MNSLIYLDETGIFIERISGSQMRAKLVVDDKIEEDIINTIPTNTKYLKFGYEIKDIPFLDFLPESLEELILSEKTNHTLNNIVNLPKNIKKLKLGGKFNEKITCNIFPKELTHLHFGTNFNQEITTNIFPDTLTHLIFGYNFNYEINKELLPKNLKYLNLGEVYNFKIKKDTLPDELKILKIPYFYFHKLEPELFPKTLKKVIIHESLSKFLVENFPKDIKVLTYHSTSPLDIIDFK